MTIHTAQVILKTTDQLPENFVTNTMHFQIDPFGGDDDLQVAAKITTAIGIFYDQAYGGVRSNQMEQTGHEVKWYRTFDPKPQVPIATIPFAFATTSDSSSLPSEVALVASYQAVPISGTSQASRRNRIYLGTWSKAASEQLDGRPKASLITSVVGAMLNFQEAGENSGVTERWSWVVFSQKLQAWAPVNNGWCDNAWDTQRRRGVQPSSRSTWVSD